MAGMIAFGTRPIVVLLLCLFLGSAEGQDDPAKEKAKAVEQMRQVANAIKQCSGTVARESSPVNQCFELEADVGPPVNVTWDLKESKSARAPYQGYVEFDLVGSWSLSPLYPTDRNKAKACKSNFQAERVLSTDAVKEMLRAQLGVADDVELPRSRVWHYRFELDVGPDDPELAKMLWTDETGKAQPLTFGHSCWVKAAQSVGTSKPDAPTPSQKGP